MEDAYYENKRENARAIYSAQRLVHSPFFGEDVVLTSDGFHHLRYSARRERKKEEQVLKFTLLPLGLRIIKTATTLQEYRKLLSPVGNPASRDGLTPMKLVQWWGFVAIFVERDVKVRVIVRKVGDGNLHFWSVMPYAKLKRGARRGWYGEGIEDK
ncbi:MAG: hypothetical protein ABSH56_00010 [Bryobacteraceae bacterium]|jgi:hypothetical protein